MKNALAATLILLLTNPGFAAGAWADLAAVPPGRNIRVHTAAGKHSGALLAVSEQAVTFRSGAGIEVAIPRPDVVKLYVETRSRRLRNTIIGTAVGVAAGAVLYGTLGSWFRNEGRDDTGIMLAVPIAIGAAAGGALPTGRMKKIYDAAKPAD
jgi:hypothetical protein